MSYNTDVLIVGAGPTGLTTAIELARRNINIRISESGDIFEIESQYLVGADGSRSIVRKTLGLPFEGSSYDWTAFLGDVWLKGHHAEGDTEQHSNDRGLAFIVPFDDGSHRVVTIDRNYQNENDTRELSKIL